MFEDREPIWPQGKKKYPEAYPWRVEAEPVRGPRRGRLRPRRGAGRRARARGEVAGRALAPRLPGPAADGRRGRRARCCASAWAPRRPSLDPRPPLHPGAGGGDAPGDRGAPGRVARGQDSLTDAEAHQAPGEASGGNGADARAGRGRGVPARARAAGRAATSAASWSATSIAALVDFPAILDGARGLSVLAAGGGAHRPLRTAWRPASPGASRSMHEADSARTRLAPCGRESEVPSSRARRQTPQRRAQFDGKHENGAPARRPVSMFT